MGRSSALLRLSPQYEVNAIKIYHFFTRGRQWFNLVISKFSFKKFLPPKNVSIYSRSSSIINLDILNLSTNSLLVHCITSTFLLCKSSRDQDTKIVSLAYVLLIELDRKNNSLTKTIRWLKSKSYFLIFSGLNFPISSYLHWRTYQLMSGSSVDILWLRHPFSIDLTQRRHEKYIPRQIHHHSQHLLRHHQYWIKIYLYPSS